MNSKCLLLASILGSLVLWTVPLSGQGDYCATAEVIPVSGPTSLIIDADGPSSGGGSSQVYNQMVSADWYTFTAPADGVLNISSCGNGSDTYLTVFSGNCDSLEVQNEPEREDDVCLSEIGPGGKEILRAAAVSGLPVAAGETYFIEWAAAWDSIPFSWTFDFIQGADGQPVGGVPFTAIPIQQASAIFPVTGLVRSNGPQVLQGATLEARVLNAGGALLASGTGNTGDIPAGEVKEVSVFNWQAPSEGIYFIQYILKNGNDDFARNDTLLVELEVTGVLYAMDRLSSTVPGGPSNQNLTQGQVFDFFIPDTIRSATALILGGSAGDVVQLQVYAYDGNEPGALLAESPQVTLSRAGPGLTIFNLEPASGGFPVEAGQQYLFALAHLVQNDEALLLGRSRDLYFPNRIWFKAGSGNWTRIEETEARETLSIRLSNDFQGQQLSLSVDMNDLIAGGALASQVSILWKVNQEDPQISEMISNGEGTYSVSLPVKSFDEITYLFVNGDGSLPAQYEVVPGNCGVSSSFFGNDLLARQVVMGFSDTEVESVCFSSCDNCSGFPCGSPTSIICDNMEDYDPGPIGPQAAHWSNLFRSNEGLVVSGESSSGDQSMLIDGTVAGQDVLLLLGDQTTGAYELSWRMSMPPGKRAYYNIQHSEAFGNYAGVIFFEENGTGNFRLNPDAPAPLVQFEYPVNAWFEVRHFFDLEQGKARLFVDGKAVFAWDFSIGSQSPSTMLGAINFFPFNLDYRFYVDNVFYQSVPSRVENDICSFSSDINDLLGGALDEARVSAVQDNRQAGSDEFDPSFGISCFEDNTGSPDNTLWYHFTGDGNRYRVRTVNCNAAPYAANTQLALYSGSGCSELQAVKCGEGSLDGPGEIIFNSENGTEYFLMVDGYNQNGFPASGQFCLEVAQTEEAVTSARLPRVVNRLNLFPNPATDQATLSMELQESREMLMELVNTGGQRLWQHREPNVFGLWTQTLELGSLPSGLYQLRIFLGDNYVTRKLIVR